MKKTVETLKLTIYFAILLPYFPVKKLQTQLLNFLRNLLQRHTQYDAAGIVFNNAYTALSIECIDFILKNKYEVK